MLLLLLLVVVVVVVVVAAAVVVVVVVTVVVVCVIGCCTCLRAVGSEEDAGRRRPVQGTEIFCSQEESPFVGSAVPRPRVSAQQQVAVLQPIEIHQHRMEAPGGNFVLYCDNCYLRQQAASLCTAYCGLLAGA